MKKKIIKSVKKDKPRGLRGQKVTIFDEIFFSLKYNEKSLCWGCRYGGSKKWLKKFYIFDERIILSKV